MATGPPFLLFYADKDTPGRDKLTQEFRDALRKVKGQAESIEVKDRNHRSLFTNIADGDPVCEVTLSFIAHHIGHPTSPKNR